MARKMKEFLSNDAKKNCISIVIPCFNEEEVIEETYQRLANVCDQLESFNFELIFIDDGSKDMTRQILKNLARKDTRVMIIGFARNFGHQIAVTAGIDSSHGDAVILIDADLQDPPELIQEMISKWLEGYEVVYGTRTGRLGESFFKIKTAKFFYRFLNRLTNIDIPADTGDFRLMSRNVVESLIAMPEQDRFIRGMVSWVGFRQVSLPYKRLERFAGSGKYSLKKMLGLALSGIFSFSTKPLQVSIALGFFSAILAVFGVIYAIGMRLFTDIWIEGWTAIVTAIFFLGGVQLICIGVLGEYIGRIYNEIKRRPLYVVEEYVNYCDNGPYKSRSPVIKF